MPSVFFVNFMTLILNHCFCLPQVPDKQLCNKTCVQLFNSPSGKCNSKLIQSEKIADSFQTVESPVKENGSVNVLSYLINWKAVLRKGAAR